MLIGAKHRVEGVTLRATDTQWTHRTGPRRPNIALVMAMGGREAALDDLEGDVATHRQRG